MKTTTKTAKTSTATGKARRLSDDEKKEVASASGTLADIAKRFSISINTAQKYRSGGTTKGKPSAAATDGRSKLTDDQRAEIAADTSSTLSQLSEKYGVSVPTIRKAAGPRRGIAKGARQPMATGATRTVSGTGGTTEGVTFTVEGGRINFSLAKNHPLARRILGDLTK